MFGDFQTRFSGATHGVKNENTDTRPAKRSPLSCRLSSTPVDFGRYRNCYALFPPLIDVVRPVRHFCHATAGRTTLRRKRAVTRFDRFPTARVKEPFTRVSGSGDFRQFDTRTGTGGGTGGVSEQGGEGAEGAVVPPVAFFFFRRSTRGLGRYFVRVYSFFVHSR